MKRVVGAAVLMVATLASLLTGCSSTPAPCGQECSGKEPNETGCDEGANTIDSTAVSVPNLEGTISIRMAAPDVCDFIYWARFEPSQQTTSSFEVIFKVNGEVVSVPGQQSDPNDPTQYAWTKGYQASPQDTLAACVIPEGLDEICIEEDK